MQAPTNANLPAVILQPQSATLSAVSATFDEDKLLIYRELYYDGFSSIIAARDLTTGAAVAVKKIEFVYMHPAPFPIRLLRKRLSKKLKRQAAKMRIISHTSVSKLIELVVEPTRMVIVTEMCMFGDLFNWMLQQQQLRVRDICLVIQYLFQALRYLHAQDYVHGNLLPTSVLFQAMSPQSVTLMPDLSTRTELLYLTGQTHSIIACWAPELLRQTLSFRSKFESTPHPVKAFWEEECITKTKMMDVWSAGIIAHIALTGKPPHQAACPQKLLEDIEDGMGIAENPIISTLSLSVINKLQQFLKVDPTTRAVAEEGAEMNWFDDERTKNDNRNILLTTEYDLMSTCRRFRLQGREAFEEIFHKDKDVPTTTRE